VTDCLLLYMGDGKMPEPEQMPTSMDSWAKWMKAVGTAQGSRPPVPPRRQDDRHVGGCERFFGREQRLLHHHRGLLRRCGRNVEDQSGPWNRDEHQHLRDLRNGNERGRKWRLRR
jgi:hypothetical protein